MSVCIIIIVIVNNRNSIMSSQDVIEHGRRETMSLVVRNICETLVRPGSDMVDEEQVTRAIAQLDGIRTATIREILMRSIDAIRSGDMNAQVSCSRDLSRLLSEQLVSSQEGGLYQACRVAWDHAHVGEMLQSTLVELDRVSFLQIWESTMKDIADGMACAEKGLCGFRTLVQRVQDARGILEEREELVDDSKREAFDCIDVRVREMVQKALVGRIGFQGGMPVCLHAACGTSPDEEHEEEPLVVLWECCAVLGIVDDAARKVSDKLIDTLIHPLMTKMGHGGSYPIGYREKVMYKILKGVAETVACGDSALIAALGKHLWEIVANIYRDMLSGDIHDDFYMKQMVFAKKLEVKASLLGFLPQGEKGPVAAATADYVKDVLVKRRAATLIRIRDAFIVPLQDQRVISFQVNDPLVPFRNQVARDSLERLMVQEGVSSPILDEDVFEELRASIHDTSLGVCESTMSVLESYKNTVEYILEAMRNTKELSDGQYIHFMKSLLDDVSALVIALVDFDMHRQSLVVYHATLVSMSCAYLSRCLSLLVLWGGVRADKHFQVCGHVAAGKIQMLGENVLKSMLSSHVSALEDDIAQLCSWKQHEDAQDIIRMKKSAQKLRHAFHRLGGSLSGSDIPDNVFIRVVSSMANATLKPILNSILQLGDISEDLSERIPRVLEDLVGSSGDHGLEEEPQGLLDCVVRGRRGKDGFCDEKYREIVNDLVEAVPIVRKLSDLCQVMRLTSREIVVWWNEGHISSFSRDELIMVIQALFEDTPQVRSSLELLQEW